MWSVSCKSRPQTYSLLTVGYFSLLQKCTDPLCSPRNLPFNWHRGSFPVAKRPGRVAKCSTPSSVQVKNGWHWTSAPPIRLHVCYTVSFTLYLLLPKIRALHQTNCHQLCLFKTSCTFHFLDAVPIYGWLPNGQHCCLYTEGSFFRSRIHVGYCETFTWFFSITPGKSPGSTWNWTTTAPFHISSKSLFINHLIIPHC